jgi:DNA-binding transcriptional LysR family regulator
MNGLADWRLGDRKVTDASPLRRWHAICLDLATAWRKGMAAQQEVAMRNLGSNVRTSIDADRLNLIASFVSVAEHLSFIAAANVIGTSPSTVSRKVSRLEDALGLRLFERTTRRVALTEAGRLYHAQCVQIFNHLADADAMVASLNSEPNGLLRVSFPVAFGRLKLSEIISEFLDAYPKVKVEANYTDRFVDLIEESYDAVVRIGSLPDSTLIARKISDNRRLVVASAAYLERHGIPHEPADLESHQCLSYSHYSASGGVWRFKLDDRIEEVKVSGEFRSDNSEAIYETALRGRGIGLVASYLCYDSIENGDLVHLLPEWTSVPEAGVYVAYSSSKHLAPKVRVFSDFLVQKLKNVPW